MPKLNDPLELLFPYLTKVGIGVKFGTRPIGWYQMHQMCALEALEKAAGSDQALIRVRGRIVQTKKQGRWINLGSTDTFYKIADNCSRR